MGLASLHTSPVHKATYIPSTQAYIHPQYTSLHTSPVHKHTYIPSTQAYIHLQYTKCLKLITANSHVLYSGIHKYFIHNILYSNNNLFLRIYDLEMYLWISKTSGIYSSVAEDVSLLECNAVFMGKQLTKFQRTLVLQNMANYSFNKNIMLQNMTLQKTGNLYSTRSKPRSTCLSDPLTTT